MLLSTSLARLGHCALDEAGAHPCVIAGLDIGHLLASMFVFGWLMLITGPILMLALAAWIMLGIIVLAWRVTPARHRRVVVRLVILTVICLEPVIATLPNMVFAALSGGGLIAVWGAVHAQAQNLRFIAPLLMIPVLAWLAFGVARLLGRPSD